jgi:hypothetical protein
MRLDVKGAILVVVVLGLSVKGTILVVVELVLIVKDPEGNLVLEYETPHHLETVCELMFQPPTSMK